jgi:hypothetical protein
LIRVVISKAGLGSRTFYIAIENPDVEKNLSYLIDGDFRKDYSGLKKGQVPPEAFHLPELERPLRTFEFEPK